MTLPDRKEIAEILRDAWGQPPYPTGEQYGRLADAIIARLRPAWEQVQRDVAKGFTVSVADVTNDAATLAECGRLKAERDALRADLAEERKIVDRVWKALGVETYEAARGKSIDALAARDGPRRRGVQHEVPEWH